MPLTLIVAAAKDLEGKNVIGTNGIIPWRTQEHIDKYREDMRRFKQLTMNNAIIMGRKTCETFSKPLEGRKNIVLTRNKQYKREGFEICGFLDQAIETASRYSETPYVIGGAEIYNMFMDLAARIEFTRIKENFNGDAFFPFIDPQVWHEIRKEERPGFDFVTYTRKND